MNKACNIIDCSVDGFVKNAYGNLAGLSLLKKIGILIDNFPVLKSFGYCEKEEYLYKQRIGSIRDLGT